VTEHSTGDMVCLASIYLRFSALAIFLTAVPEVERKKKKKKKKKRERGKQVVGLERGPLSLVSTTEELLDKKVAAPV
jgi:hypothetical protein